MVAFQSRKKETADNKKGKGCEHFGHEDEHHGGQELEIIL